MAAEITNKELLLKMYDCVQENLQTTARLEEKLNGLQTTLVTHQQQIDALSKDKVDPKDFAELTENMAAVTKKLIENEKQTLTIKDLVSKVKENTKCIDEIKNAPGKTALTVWKKIGSYALTAIISSCIAALISYFKR